MKCGEVVMLNFNFTRLASLLRDLIPKLVIDT